jgi:hypothetical protein
LFVLSSFKLKSLTAGQTECQLECDRGYEKFGSGLYKCLKNGNEQYGRKEINSITCRDLCSRKLKLECQRENKQLCKPGIDECGNCLPGYISKGTQCEATCSQEKRRECIRKNRHSCDPKGKESKCGDCIDNYRPNSENDSESPCVERFIPVPVSAEIKDIDLSTRSLRIKLQNAFRRMVDQLNTEMSLQTNNFEQIDRNDVVLVRSTSNPSPDPKPSEWV